jgi:hypothetical protein
MLTHCQAYIAMTELYRHFGVMPTKDFNHLVDTSNHVGQILLSHYIAFHVITYPVITYQSSHRDLSGLFNNFFTWAKDIHARLPPAFKSLNEWPINCMRAFYELPEQDQLKLKS